MRLEIDLEEHDDLTVIRPRGDMDVSTVPALRQVLDRHDPERTQMVIDLSEVTMLDSSGLGALVGLRNRARGQREVALVCPHGPQRRLLQLTGLHRAFVLGTDLDGVRAALARGAERPGSAHP